MPSGHGEAEEAFRSARGVFAEEGLGFERARCELGLGMALYQLGRNVESEEVLGSARAIFTELGVPVQVAFCDLWLGWVLATTGAFAVADTAFASAGTVFAEEANPDLTAQCETGRGLAHYAANRFEEAEDALSRAKEWATDPSMCGSVALLRGMVFLQVGRLAEAVEMSTAARETFAGRGQASAAASCDLTIAFARSLAGQTEDAARLVVQAREAARPFASAVEITSYDQVLGVVLLLASGSASIRKAVMRAYGLAPPASGLEGTQRTTVRPVPQEASRRALSDGLASLLPATLFLDAQRARFATATRRRAWADMHVRNGLAVALEAAAELGDPRLVAELAESSKTFATLSPQPRQTGGVRTQPLMMPLPSSGLVGVPHAVRPRIGRTPAVSLLGIVTASVGSSPSVRVRPKPRLVMPWHRDDDYALRRHHERAQTLYGEPTTATGNPASLLARE